MSKKLLFIIGTRPELIKVFPIVRYLKSIGNNSFKVVSTGQHKELLQPYWKVFNMVPDYELNIIKKGQNLSSLTVRAISAIDGLISKNNFSFKPDVIIAQGDTTTVMAASIVSFYNNIKFAHIEAGLRSGDLYNPFPEELNRKIAGLTAHYHFAPTKMAMNNLLKENINRDNIHVVGNTVVDTLYYFLKSGILKGHEFICDELRGIKNQFVLITCHRRENHTHLEELIESIHELSVENNELTFIWPVHPNPAVKNRIFESNLAKKSNVKLIPPLEYLDLLKVISQSRIVISDSGGIQEEAPSFNVPVLILREKTERPEAVEMGYSLLVGMNKNRIKKGFYDFKIKNNDKQPNPYGDGNSSERIIKIINEG